MLVAEIVPASAFVPSALAPHHTISLTLDPATGKIEVLDRIEIFGRKDIALHIAAWMSISDVQIDGKPTTVRPSNGVMMLTLPNQQRHRIDVLAIGLVPTSIGNKAGYGSGAHSMMSRDGVYLPASAGWVPTTGDDRMSFRLTIKTPTHVRAVATGTLESEALDETQNVAVFSSTQIEERPSVFAGPYAVSEQTIAGIRIRTYFHHSVKRLAREYISAASRYLQFFGQEIGPYPFSDFYIVSAPIPVGLGFAGLTYIDRRILPLPFIRNRSLAHEVLHNWFGNGIRTGYKSGNWSEGLTTYLADHELAARRDPRRAAEMRLGWLRDYAALPKARDIPIVRFQHKAHDAAQVVGYGKVALVFHMLRHELGDSVFKKGLRRFWKTYKFRSASWTDLRNIFEASAQTDLGWFFDQWTQRSGAPRLALAQASVKARQNGFELDLTLTQSAPTYRLKVPVEVVTANGLIRTHVKSERKRTNGRISLDTAPGSIRVDPNYTLFRRLLPGEAPPILRDVLLDGKARTVLLYDDTSHLVLAQKLAERMFGAQTPPKYVEPELLRSTALLVIGPAQQIDNLIQRLDAPARPADVSGKGRARAWMARQANGNAILFIEADEIDDLQAFLRPLPHYRSKSYVVLEGGRVVKSGVFPSTRNPLVKQMR